MFLHLIRNTNNLHLNENSLQFACKLLKIHQFLVRDCQIKPDEWVESFVDKLVNVIESTSLVLNSMSTIIELR